MVDDLNNEEQSFRLTERDVENVILKITADRLIDILDGSKFDYEVNQDQMDPPDPINRRPIQRFGLDDEIYMLFAKARKEYLEEGMRIMRDQSFELTSKDRAIEVIRPWIDLVNQIRNEAFADISRNRAANRNLVRELDLNIIANAKEYEITGKFNVDFLQKLVQEIEENRYTTLVTIVEHRLEDSYYA